MKDDFLKDTEKARARERALYLLGYRDHSKQELLSKLKRTNNEEASIYAVNRMEELGLINDEVYAKKLARDLIFRKKISGQRLKIEMFKKGIDKELIDQTIEEIDCNPEVQMRSILQKKYSQYQNDEKVKRRAISALQRLGYKWDDIKSVIKGDDDYA